MPLLVDTYNVLHVTGVLPPDLAGIGLSGLIERIRGSRFRDEIVYLVCDGGLADTPRPADEGRIRLRYAGPGRLADDLIAGMIARSTAPRRLVVVSSDRAVRRNARRRRCRTLTSDRFLAQLALDAEQGGRGVRPAHAPPPRDVELPATVISEAEAMEAAWQAALKESPPAAGPPTVPKAPEIPTAPSVSAPGGRDDPHAIIPRSILEEAEALLRREGGDDIASP